MNAMDEDIHINSSLTDSNEVFQFYLRCEERKGAIDKIYVESLLQSYQKLHPSSSAIIGTFTITAGQCSFKFDTVFNDFYGGFNIRDQFTKDGKTSANYQKFTRYKGKIDNIILDSLPCLFTDITDSGIVISIDSQLLENIKNIHHHTSDISYQLVKLKEDSRAIPSLYLCSSTQNTPAM
jgi:hypothetical protein